MVSSPPHLSKHLKPLYQLVMNNFLLVVVVPVTAAGLLRKAVELGPDEILSRLHGLRQVHVFLAVFLPFALATLCMMRRPRSVYLVDYACCRPKPNCRVSVASFTENARCMPYLDDGALRFLTRMLHRSGLGNQTYLHPSLHNIPPRCCLSSSRDEAEQVIFAAMDDLLAKTGISPEDIDILVTNCTAFNPTPSIADMIVNRYKLRDEVRSMHVSGMGCSAGVIAVEVASNLLQAAPRGARALVVSTETSAGPSSSTCMVDRQQVPAVNVQQGKKDVTDHTGRPVRWVKLLRRLDWDGLEQNLWWGNNKAYSNWDGRITSYLAAGRP